MAIHFIVQCKGGLGKSIIASLLIAYLRDSGQDVLCASVDPFDSTVSRYANTHVDDYVPVDWQGNVDHLEFNKLIEKLLQHSGSAVVDISSSMFIPFLSYMYGCGILAIFKQHKKRAIFHTILVGGDTMRATLVGLRHIINRQLFPLIVWENEQYGKVTQNHTTFIQSVPYQRNHQNIWSVIKLHKNICTLGKKRGKSTGSSAPLIPPSDGHSHSTCLFINNHDRESLYRQLDSSPLQA